MTGRNGTEPALAVTESDVTVSVNIETWSCRGTHRKVAERAFLAQLRQWGVAEEILKREYPGERVKAKSVVESSYPANSLTEMPCMVHDCDRPAYYWFYRFWEIEHRVAVD